MKIEDKGLLLKDLCARLLYGVKVFAKTHKGNKIGKVITITTKFIDYSNGDAILGELYTDDECFWLDCGLFKPYLRPMSSMTKEEKKELLNLLFDKEAKYFYIDKEGLIDGKTSDLMKEGLNYPAFCPINIVLYTDWLNAHHFDYHGLIKKGLALEAKDGMYNKA